MGKLKDQIIMYKDGGKGMSVDFDIVPLVRCAECKHYQADPETGIWVCMHKDGLMTAKKKAWCSYAEEKNR